MHKKASKKSGSDQPPQHAFLLLPVQELYAVLRATDDVIGEGGVRR